MAHGGSKALAGDAVGLSARYGWVVRVHRCIPRSASGDAALAPLERYSSQFLKIIVAAVPAAISGRSVRFGSSTLSGSLRSARARFSNRASLCSVSALKYPAGTAG